jgi:5-methylcytosine-specific restriction endonuclease McrA
MRRVFKPRKCENCGEEFIPRTSRTRWCERCCTLTCPACGKAFGTDPSMIKRGQKTCSPECSIAYKYGKPRKVTEKECTNCKQTKPADEFYKDKRRRDGLYSWCKECFDAHARTAYHLNIDKERARSRIYGQSEAGRKNSRKRCRRWYYKNHERAKLLARNNQARRRSNDTEIINYESILKRDGYVCYLCGLPVKPEDINFDHKIPLSRGGAHTEENIGVTHEWCNKSKKDKTPKEYWEHQRKMVPYINDHENNGHFLCKVR